MRPRPAPTWSSVPRSCSFEAESYRWSTILAVYRKDHPECAWVLAALSNPLPCGFLAVALLDTSNGGQLEGSNEAHPFDSDAGVAQLRSWLTDRDEQHFSYARSTAVALAFLNTRNAGSCFRWRLTIPRPRFRLKRPGRRRDREARQEFVGWRGACLDVNRSDIGRRYLDELGRADAIPQACMQAEFAAKAQFAGWLAHPNELGRGPDELEVVDHRTLSWPTFAEPKPFWLIKYRLKDTTGLLDDDVGVGLVGSMTFCFFGFNLDQRPPEDGYALHCYWELSHLDMVADAQLIPAPRSTTDY